MIHKLICLCILVLILPTDLYAQVDLSDVTIKEVSIVSGKTGEAPSDANKTVQFADDITLHIVIGADDTNGSYLFYCDVDTIILDNNPVSTRPISELINNADVSWFKIENNCKEKWYSNTEPDWHWDRLDYTESHLGNFGFSIPCDVAPTILTPVVVDRQAVGTMRFRVKVVYKDKKYASTGMDSRYKNCISEDIHRVSRKGSTGVDILDFGLALCNSPYIWGSASFTGSKFDNQAERYLGADCADLAVASARMAGYTKMPYGGSRTLGPSTDRIAKTTKIRNRIYCDKNTNTIPIGTEGVLLGDFIIWDGHIGLLYQDNEPIGLLDESDLVFHTLFAEPRIVSLENAYKKQFEIRRPKAELRQ